MNNPLGKVIKFVFDTRRCSFCGSEERTVKLNTMHKFSKLLSLETVVEVNVCKKCLNKPDRMFALIND